MSGIAGPDRPRRQAGPDRPRGQADPDRGSGQAGPDGGSGQAGPDGGSGRAGPSGGRRKLRGVITDWGGVLTNPILETVNAWIELEGVDRDSYAAVMRPWVMQAYAPDGKGSPIHALERGECTDEEFERLLASRLTRVDGSPVPADGLLARMFAATLPDSAMHGALRAIRRAGFRTALLSNSWGANDYPRHLFPELFDAVVISSEAGMRKPERRIFLHATGLLGLEPAECIFIDDIEANVLAAEAVGMVGVHHSEHRSTTQRLSELLGIRLDDLDS
jgi:putative hydrolase of the HAD superfamily